MFLFVHLQEDSANVLRKMGKPQIKISARHRKLNRYAQIEESAIVVHVIANQNTPDNAAKSENRSFVVTKMAGNVLVRLQMNNIM